MILSGFCFFAITDPPRGHCETTNQGTDKYAVQATTWKADMKALIRKLVKSDFNNIRLHYYIKGIVTSYQLEIYETAIS